MSDLTELKLWIKKKNKTWESPGDLVVRTLGVHCGGPGSTPGWGTEIHKPCGMAKRKRKQRNVQYEVANNSGQIVYKY